MSYDVVGLLGRGGTAVVELAVDSTGRMVATKRVALSGSEAQMRVAQRRLRREAEILSTLAHPGVVPMIDVIEDSTEVILVFPVLDESLEDRVRRLGPLPPNEVARIGRVLLDALGAVHRLGIVHRDIKPSNVLFDHTGAPALSDFGVAVTREVTGGLTGSGAAVGTPMWMSPEQARGEPAGPAGDVFSLAATLAFAATGQGPYRPGPPLVVLDRAARGQIQPLSPTVPRMLRTPLERMLDPRPKRRPSAASVLGGLDGTSVIPARPAGPTAKAARAGRVVAGWPRRILRDPPDRPPGAWSPVRWTATIVAAAVTAGLAGLVAVALTSSTPVPAPHTDGRGCAAGWFDLDGNRSDGCEARSDYVAGSVLSQKQAVHANLVPASATDVFATHVSGDVTNLCWGSLRVTLTAPPQTAEQLTVWKGTNKVADALSANGRPATATVHKPSCFSGDSEDLRVVVTALAATGGASAQDFTLSRDSGW